MRGAQAANSSMSMSAWSLRPAFSRVFRRPSGGSSRSAGRLTDLCGPFRQSFTPSALRCGTCRNGEAAPATSLGLMAWTMQRWRPRTDRMASAEAFFPTASSAIARTRPYHLGSSVSRSSARPTLSSSRRRCTCTRKSSSALLAAACGACDALRPGLSGATSWSCLLISASSDSSSGRARTAAFSALPSRSSCAAPMSIDACTPSSSACMVARSTPLEPSSLPPPMHHSIVTGTPMTKKSTKSTRTRPWFSLLTDGSATLSSTLVGPSGFPYLS
mmetsp:Transcript_75845/g.214447  ORF Transcript_75845/g.214447 Transcript_75845/m.214447 type:complete len:274 (+) Transcript_75845:522-1343(+)